MKRIKKKILPFLLAVLIIAQSVYGFSTPVHAAELPEETMEIAIETPDEVTEDVSEETAGNPTEDLLEGTTENLTDDLSDLSSSESSDTPVTESDFEEAEEVTTEILEEMTTEDLSETRKEDLPEKVADSVDEETESATEDEVEDTQADDQNDGIDLYYHDEWEFLNTITDEAFESLYGMKKQEFIDMMYFTYWKEAKPEGAIGTEDLNAEVSMTEPPIIIAALSRTMLSAPEVDDSGIMYYYNNGSISFLPDSHGESRVTHRFTWSVTSGGTPYPAYCWWAEKSSPPTGMVSYSLITPGTDTDALESTIYLGENNPALLREWWNNACATVGRRADWGFNLSNADDIYCFTHLMTSYFRNSNVLTDIGYSNYGSGDLATIVGAVATQIRNYTGTPYNFRVYNINVRTDDSSPYQNLIFGTYRDERTSLTLKKSWTEQAQVIVDQYPSLFSLSGATYGVYTNEACTTSATLYNSDSSARSTNTLVTNSSGTTDTIYVTQGTYYIREITPPENAVKNNAVYTATVGTTAVTVNMTEDVIIPMQVHKSWDTTSQPIVNRFPELFTLEGAEYTIYTDVSCTTSATGIKDTAGNAASNVFVTNSSGESQVLFLSPGNYYIKETKTPPNAELDTNVYPITAENTPVNLNVTESTTIPLRLQKSCIPSCEQLVAGNPNYSLAGAQYRIYMNRLCTIPATVRDAAGNILADPVLTTDENGNSNMVIIEPDTYFIKEIHASKGYILDTDVYRMEVTYESVSSSGIFTFESTEIPVGDPAEITLAKKDAEGISTAPLEGAVFKVSYYNDFYDRSTVGGATPKATWYIQTKWESHNHAYIARMDNSHIVSEYTSSPFYYDANGMDIIFPIGTVTYEEFTPPIGYKLPSDGGEWIDVTGSQDSYMSIAQIRGVDNNNDGSTDIAQMFYEGANASTEANGSGQMIRVFTVADPDSNIGINEQIKRGDFSFTKKDYETLAKMPYCFFRVTSSTGESHIVVTGADGVYSSAAAAHSTNTNGYDELYEQIFDLYYNADGTVKSGVDLDLAAVHVRNMVNALGETGLWFYGTADTSEWDSIMIDDAKGACRYDDSYIIEELPCPIASKLETQLMVPAELSITQDGRLVAMGTFTNMPEPLVNTREWDNDTDSHYSVGVDGTVNAITDTFVYQYLKANTTYTMKGILIEINDDGSIIGPLRDANGDMIRANHVFTTDNAELNVSPLSARGSEDNVFTFDGSNLNGIKFVIFEYLYLGADNDLIECDAEGNVTVGNAVASHADTSDDKQIGMFVGLGTKAFMTDSGETVVKVSDDMKISDICEYQYVVPGLTTTIRGELMYKDDTGAVHPILDADGNPVVAETTFLPDTTEGSVQIDFPAFDGRQLLDADGYLMTGGIVCYETMEIASMITVPRQNIDDLDETIRVLEFHTNATDSETEDHISYADRHVTIYDEVSYQGLLVGVRYRIEGILMNTDTGEPLLDADGNEITAETSFVCSSSRGTARLSYTFDGSLLQGATTTVFEDLYEEDIHIGTHADIHDEAQTVHFPKIGTKLLDEDGKQIVITKEKVVITPTDTVSYTNLVAGREYKIQGTLMNTRTKQPVKVNGKDLTETLTFIPDTPDGVVRVEFPTFDIRESDLRNPDNTYAPVVCFETLYYHNPDTNEDIEVTDHRDWDDEDQTLVFKSFARVQILKTGPFLVGTTEYELRMPDGTKKKVSRMDFEQRPFAGITFTIYDAKTDEAVTSFVSGADGTAVSDLIPAGEGQEYYVMETDTPGGLVQSTEKYPVELTLYDDEESCFYNPEIKVVNQVTGAKLNVYKEGEIIIPNTTDGYGIARKGIANVYFGIFADEDIKDNAGEVVVKKDTLISILKTDEEGLASATESLVAGKYYYRELYTASEEYELDTGKYEFTITYKRNTTEEVVSFELNYSSPLLNNYKKQDVELYKVDQNDTPIPGVVFDLYRKYRDEYRQIGRYTTDNDGRITLRNVPYGEYYFIETKGKDGYEFDGETKYEFVINDETIDKNEPIRIKAVNNRTEVQTGDGINLKLLISTFMLMNMLLTIMGIWAVFRKRHTKLLLSSVAAAIDLASLMAMFQTADWMLAVMPTVLMLVMMVLYGRTVISPDRAVRWHRRE